MTSKEEEPIFIDSNINEYKDNPIERVEFEVQNGTE